MGAKSIDSRHFIATDAYARIVGLTQGDEVAGRLDRDMPCEATARFADSFVRGDQELLGRGRCNAMKSTLDLHEYSNGLKALIFDKFVMKHHASKSILGVVYSAYEVDMRNFFALLPNYTREFGLGCSIERADGDSILADVRLTAVEYEMCFLLAMNWSVDQISCFMNTHRAAAEPDVNSTLHDIGEKLRTDNAATSALREKLIELGVHQRMPRSFFNHIIGVHTL
ncbi:MAG TPA: hypothetical protein VGZ01_04335 [Trinickia sp.]|nr:hypothetical protein [Trinickia sp.]